ncbi:MAG: Na/Pi symporter [Alistipes indistinctus]
MIVQILILLGAVGLFLFGMKTMSEALQKLSGHRLRNMLTTMAGSPVRGIVASTAITALVQSSSAVTVMIVSFVNAGMLHLTQAIAMVMGANIGTTVTAWLVVLFGISFDIDLAAVPLIAFAAPLLLLR